MGQQDSRQLVSIVQRIRSCSQAFDASYRSAEETLRTFTAETTLADSDIVGRRVLDWECGIGAYAARFLEVGASQVTAIDTFLDTDFAEKRLAELPGARFERTAIEAFSQARQHLCAYDLVFTNTVTEHLLNLPRALILAYQLLDENGVLVLNHDNYYQPVGSHDHGFLFYDNDNRIVFQGQPCWDRLEKCSVSAEHRRSIMRRFPWTWDAQMESQLSPEDCSRCPYYRRAQPWAHLIYQAEFRRLFPQPSFTTGYPKSSLNKVTPFQLRQFIIEAGFEIERWVPHRVHNHPPEALLRPPFTFGVDDLRTSTITVRCRKGSQPPYTGGRGAIGE